MLKFFLSRYLSAPPFLQCLYFLKQTKLKKEIRCQQKNGKNLRKIMRLMFFFSLSLTWDKVHESEAYKYKKNKK